MRPKRFTFIVVALLLVGAGAAWAGQGAIVRVLGSSVNPTQDLDIGGTERFSLGDGTTLTAEGSGKIEADSAFGLCLDFEHRLSQRLGINVSVMRSRHQIELSGRETTRITDDATGSVLFEDTENVSMKSERGDVTPFLVGPNFHFGPSAKLDLYAGPFVGFVVYDDVEFQGERLGIDEDFAYGATVGVDIPFSQKLAFSGAARYMVSEAKPNEPDSQTLDMDSLVLQFGIGYRF